MKFFKAFWSGMKFFGHCMNSLVNTIILTIAYLLGIGLTSIVAKLSKKHFLELHKKNTNTYWKDLKLGKTKEDYEHQF